MQCFLLAEAHDTTPFLVSPRSVLALCLACHLSEINRGGRQTEVSRSDRNACWSVRGELEGSM